MFSLSLAAADGSPLRRRCPASSSRCGCARGRRRRRSSAATRCPASRRRAYRISVKREPHGAASGHLRAHVGPATPSTSPRRAARSPWRTATDPVLLVSAGVGVTPVLAMLHALAARQRPHAQVWWLHGARDGDRAPLRRGEPRPARRPPRRTRHVFYSRPAADDRQGVDYTERAGSRPTCSPDSACPGRRRLPLRPDSLHGRRHRRPRRLRPGAGPGPHRGLRRRARRSRPA